MAARRSSYRTSPARPTSVAIPPPRTRRGAAWRVVRALLCAAAALGGCTAERVIDVPVAVRIADATSCRPSAAIESLRLRALGDGPGSEGATIEVLREQALRELPRLGFPTLAVWARAEAPGWAGEGWRPIGAAGDALAILPLARSCPIDADARAPEGAATVLTADGALMVLGGLDGEGAAIARVVRLAPGAQLAELGAASLALPTAHASATGLLDGRVLVAGGTFSAGALPSDRYEVLDPRGEGPQVIEPLATRRRDHAAIALADGRVLLVGGRASEGAAAMTSMEIVDASARETQLTGARLGRGRAGASLALARDAEGRVWIAGGEEDAAGEPTIERYDPARDELRSLALGALPTARALAWLEAGRLAWIGERSLHVIVARGDAARVAVGARATPELDAARAVAIEGRVLVVGERAGARVAYVVDPGDGRAEVRDASRVPSALIAMVDGSVVELSASGASLRRERGATPWDDPPAVVLFDDPEDDVLWVRDPTGDARWDAPSWRLGAEGLEARAAGARVDLRALRGSRWELALDARGAVEVRLRAASGVLGAASGAEVVIAIDDASARVGACVAARGAGEPIAIGVAPGALRVLGVECGIASAGPFALAFLAAEPGAVLRRLEIARR